jgi:hypothetical protein
MPLDRANRVFLHPIHQDAARDIVQLVADLRVCNNYLDYYDFQQALLCKVLDVQAHRGSCTRVAKRLYGGRGRSRAAFR